MTFSEALFRKWDEEARQMQIVGLHREASLADNSSITKIGSDDANERTFPRA